MFDYEFIKKIFFQLSPENAHNVAEFSFKYGAKIFPFSTSYFAEKYFVVDKRLEQNILGTTFVHPLGLAAGFDKNATMIRMLNALGFGHIEYGTVTPIPQDGNAKPRLFRYPEYESIQNAMGFNNDGMLKIKNRLKNVYPYAIPLGANIGKNKTTSQEESIGDYEKLIENFKDLCEYIVINISSPNTPGLRDLQNENFIKELFTMASEKTSKPVLLKLAPDLDTKDAITLSSKALEYGAKGIVATNTSIDYTLLPEAKDFGGISGRVLEEKSSALFEALAKEFFGKTTLISVGGIDNADTAYKRIKAGANLIQLYSSFIFKGPAVTRDIAQGILAHMNRDGFHHISEAIGADRR